MGDGDEVIGLSPSFFLLRMSSGLVSPILSCLPLPALSDPRMSCVPLSPSCLSSVWACGGAWSVVPSCGAVSLVVRRSFLVSIVGLLAFFVSVLSAGRMSADYLPCVSRLGAQCGRRVACHAWVVPIIGAGGGTGFLCLLGWDWRGSVWINVECSFFLLSAHFVIMYYIDNAAARLVENGSNDEAE